MLIRRPRILALAGVPLLALAACGDLLSDDPPAPRRVLVQLNDAEFGRPVRVGYPLRLELFASDAGGLGVRDVEVRWLPQAGSVDADRERTNGNGFVEATWTPGTLAGDQRVVVEMVGLGAADTLQLHVLPDTVVGAVTLEAEADTVVEGESQTVTLSRVEDRHGNAYDLVSTREDGPPPIHLATLDPAVLEVSASRTTARVTALAAGTGRVVATVGGRADTVTIVVEAFVPPGSFRQVDAGAAFGCGITPTGTAFCWGENSGGQLGTGSTDSPGLVPATPAGFAGREAETVDAGHFHGCALLSGEAWCWGDNSAGQLGDGSTDTTLEPVRAGEGMTFTQVETGLYHTCGLDAAGAAWCWGDNSAGQMGLASGPGDPVTTPTRVEMPAGVSFTQLAVGGVHACGLTAAGAAWCWGDNSTGQLGSGTFDPVTGVAEVRADGAVFATLGLGVLHGCGITTAGQVRCWGDNSSNQLGDGGTDPSPVPIPVSGALTAVDVAGGFFHTCAVAAAPDGRVFCWGMNATGQLGNDSRESSAVPVAVESGAVRFVSVDTENEHTCALGTDSEGYCWGRNSSGELGSGSAGADVLKPVRVISPLAPSAFRTPAARSAATRARLAPTRPESACRQLPRRLRSRLDVCS